MVVAITVGNDWSTVAVILGLLLVGISEGTLLTLLFNVLVSASPKRPAGDVGALRGVADNVSATTPTQHVRMLDAGGGLVARQLWGRAAAPGGGGKKWLMDDRFVVAVGAGTLMSDSTAAARFPHRWTPEGVTVEADFTGGHLLHLAAAGCVLNDVYREAARLGIDVKGVRVTAAGGFDTATWQSTGISYSVEVSCDASAGELARLLEVVDEVAEIPHAIRAGAIVRRVPEP